MADLREAAKLALEALEPIAYNSTDDPRGKAYEAIAALKRALAEEQPDLATVGEVGVWGEPVANAMQTVIKAMQSDPDYAWSWHCNVAMAFVDAGGNYDTANQGAARFMRILANVDPAHELPKKQPADEPAAWVGLTDNEVRETYGKDLNYKDGDYARFARAIEAKLKEKNA